MPIDIGKKIRELRLGMSMTQDQLAQKLKLSSQAVSKWENGTTMPDIQILPELSILFGVSIDSLFSLTDEDRMERIENSIYDVRFYEESEFEAAVRWLQDKQKEDRHRSRATLLLAMLYNKRADEFHELASPLAREALRLDPTVKDAHNAVFDAERGPYLDWNAVNHHDTIAFYKELLAEHPEDFPSHLWLMDLLIADGRTAEARQVLEQAHRLKDSYHYEMYRGLIAKAECDLPAALDWWGKMTAKDPENGVVWFEYADNMARLCRYEDAIAAYEKGMPLRPEPQFVDPEECLAHIYEILGDREKAAQMHEQILTIMQEQWNITEGESLDSHRREIQRLRSRKQ